MRKRVYLVPKLIGVCLLLLIALSVSVAITLADESVSATCYLNQSVGNVSVGSVVVFNVANAAQACNSMYNDCRGRCIGCIYDNDYVHDVCVDVSGRTFLRP
jgi:hypothetical protein